MAKNCARCSKTVYAIEELKCLEKVWHKTCFKCTECGMMLNMKTYKGFDRWPYCEAHIPKAKATTIAETPELKRIAENTKIQSNVKYHAEFEKTKGKLTQVADDPETLRIRQNTKNFSNASYHGEYLKKEKMERQRELADVVENKDLHESEYFSEQLAAENISDYRPAKKYEAYEDESPPPPAPQSVQPQQQQPRRDAIQKKSPIDERSLNLPPAQHSHNNGSSMHQSIPASNHNQQYRQQDMPVLKSAANSANANNMRELAYQQQKQHHQQQLLLQQQQQLLYQQQLAQQQQQMLDSRNLAKSAQYPRAEATNNYMSNSVDHSMNHRNNIQTQNDNYAEMLQQQYMHVQQQQAQHQAQKAAYQQQQQAYALQQQQQAQQQQQQQQQQAQQAKQQQSVGKAMRIYRALYDYEAQDSDEVSFFEGDMIVEMNEIDSGWLTGRVDRTGLVGLVPANYLEIQNI